MTNQPKKATTRRKPTAENIEDSPAYFLSLELENVLCFKDKQKLNLTDIKGNPAQWTVILGNNGVGKTTLLRCLAGMELQPTWIKTSKRFLGTPLLHGLNDLPFDDDSIWKDADTLAYNNAVVQAEIFRGTYLSTIKEVECLDSYKHEIKVKMGKTGNISKIRDKTQLVCYGYGATRRMGKTSLGEGYIAKHSSSLFSDNVTLINAEEWLLQTDYAFKSSSQQTRSHLKKEFDRIIDILKRILPEIEDIHIAPADGNIPRPRVEFLTPYGWVSLSSLGLGYRTTIAWMVDLAVRLFKRYPDSEDPLAEPAIVLVDEIDLHMHPQWQRTIMEFLTERFPNTQFIVTAHSPLVVQAAQDANIVLLRREGDRVVIDNNPEIIENWRVDQVLTSIFEMPSARPAKIEPLLARRQEILTKSKLTKADKAELKELEEKIGTLPTAETSEDIKAMDIIRRAAKLLEKSSAEAVE